MEPSNKRLCSIFIIDKDLASNVSDSVLLRPMLTRHVGRRLMWRPRHHYVAAVHGIPYPIPCDHHLSSAWLGAAEGCDSDIRAEISYLTTFNHSCFSRAFASGRSFGSSWIIDVTKSRYAFLSTSERSRNPLNCAREHGGKVDGFKSLPKHERGVQQSAKQPLPDEQSKHLTFTVKILISGCRSCQ